jgi:uncharacterized cupredoxin-like copper-binding protein
MRKLGVFVGLAALLFVACGEEAPEATGPETLEVRAANYTFAAPESVKAGAVELTLKNAGPEPHQAQLLKLNEGATPKQVIAASKNGDLGVEKLGTWAGGPNAVDAGESQVTTADLAAGSYVFMCLVPDAKGRPHASLGMVKALTVEENPDAQAAELGTYTASTKEYDFVFPDAWTGPVTVTNNGKQPHEFQIMEIAKGKTEKDFTDWFKAAPGTAGPPTWTTGGGVASIAPGASETFRADVKPGTYFLMCFVTDPQKKAPHFALGMLKKFVVK